MEPKFFKYCSNLLKPNGFIIFQALSLMMNQHETETSITRIAEVSGSSKTTISRQLSVLQKKGFILYKSVSGIGVLIFWVRSSQSQQVPDLQSVSKDHQIVVRKVGTKRCYSILPGDIKKFCAKQGIAEVSLKKLREGKQKTAKGWELVA